MSLIDYNVWEYHLEMEYKVCQVCDDGMPTSDCCGAPFHEPGFPDNDICSEIYLDSKKKLSRQLEYASKRGLSLAIICGENEFNNNTITIKNLQGIKGENQILIPKEKLANEVKKFL